MLCLLTKQTNKRTLRSNKIAYIPIGAKEKPGEDHKREAGWTRTTYKRQYTLWLWTLLQPNQKRHPGQRSHAPSLQGRDWQRVRIQRVEVRASCCTRAVLPWKYHSRVGAPGFIMTCCLSCVVSLGFSGDVVRLLSRGENTCSSLVDISRLPYALILLSFCQKSGHLIPANVRFGVSGARHSSAPWSLWAGD